MCVDFAILYNCAMEIQLDFTNTFYKESPSS